MGASRTIALPVRHRKVGALSKADCLGFERLSHDGKDEARVDLIHAIRRQLRNSWTRAYRWAADGSRSWLPPLRAIVAGHY